MNSESGAHVFRTSRGRAALVAYAKMPRSDGYMMLALRHGYVYLLVVSFSDLLDVVPVRAFSMSATLTVLDTVENTLRAWRTQLTEALTRLNASSRCEDSSPQTHKRVFTDQSPPLPPMQQPPPTKPRRKSPQSSPPLPHVAKSNEAPPFLELPAATQSLVSEVGNGRVVLTVFSNRHRKEAGF